jgi:excisionase family DNA binding protein
MQTRDKSGVPQRATYSVYETAQLLGVSKWTLQRAIKRGELLHIRVGKRIMVPKHAVDALLGLRTTPAPKPRDVVMTTKD